jgi:ribosomal protein S6--L-glutamate ligase
MKILIVGPKKKSNILLAQAARKRNHQVKLADLNDFQYTLRNDLFKIVLGNEDIKNFDVALIRGVSPQWGQAKTVAKYMARHGKTVVDRELSNKVYEFDKMFMYAALCHHGLPCIDTFFFPSFDSFKKFKQKLKYPLLVKDIKGMHGRNIFTEKNKRQLAEFLKTHNIDDFFVQELIVSDYYIRVLVVGGKVVGAIKRFTLQHLAREKVDKLLRSQNYKLTAAEKKLAIKAAKAVNADIAGLDLIYDKNNRPYVLEVNRCPEFTCFTRVTGVDAAAEIIKFLETVGPRR